MSALSAAGYRPAEAAAPYESGYIIEFSGIMSNPTLAKMKEGAELARRNNVGLIIAIGGGSVMDCCKAVSVQAGYDGDAWNDFWIEGRPMTHEIIPCGAVVTMPATGSEVNGCAVLTNEETRIKCDRDYPEMNPVFALMDPAYTLTMPLRQLRAGTFDILSHIMETYFSRPLYDNPADDIAEGLMKGLIRDFRAAMADPQDMRARSNIMWCASLAENRIIKTGKTKDFQAHNMEHQLSAYTDCNHGEGLAVLHPVYYRHIYRDGVSKFAGWAQRVWGITAGDAAESTGHEAVPADESLALAGIEALEDFIREMGLPTTLRELGFGEEERELLPGIAESCFISEGAFRPLTADEILEIYQECW
jgi:alcohol dehydrogenase YqhD (iron-dependent ADH family)